MVAASGKYSEIQRGAAAVAISLSVFSVPSLAWAGNVEGTAVVGIYTAGAMMSAVVLTFLLALGLKIAIGVGVIGDDREFIFRQRLRVLFGSTFLLAAVTPYVALNFSMSMLFPFVGGAGLIIAAWVWGATKVDLELDSDPA